MLNGIKKSLLIKSIFLIPNSDKEENVEKDD